MMNDPYAYTQQPLHRKPMPPHLQPSYSGSDAPYNHTRSPSSSTAQSHPVPSINYPASHTAQSPNIQNPYTSRRTPSMNTFSTTASGGQKAYPNMSPIQPGGSITYSQAQRESDLRRSTSSRSNSSITATSYVQLLRKQKATVWCDRSQTLDARLVASQKAQKLRAQAEMRDEMGKSRSGTMTTSTLGQGQGKALRVTAKIRHHGKSGLTGFSGQEGNYGVGVGGVPMRLSASEVDGEQSDEEDSNGQRTHRRTGSGRSSLRHGQSYRSSSGQVAGTGNGNARESGRWSRDGTPPSGGTSGRNSLAELAEASETPQLERAAQREYFPTVGASHPVPDRKNSSGSGSSAERGDSVQDLNAARVASNTLLKSGTRGAGVGRQQSTRNPEELRRRGSVDERTATMTLSSGMGRLYIANPDSGDSD